MTNRQMLYAGHESLRALVQMRSKQKLCHIFRIAKYVIVQRARVIYIAPVWI